MAETARDVIALALDDAFGPPPWRMLVGEALASVALAALASASPDVKLDLIRQLMPEPTEEMLDAGDAVCVSHCKLGSQMHYIWRAMIGLRR